MAEHTLTGQTWDRVPIDAQSIEAPLSQAAAFLVVTVKDGDPVVREPGLSHCERARR